jgi:hypothetical protein
MADIIIGPYLDAAIDAWAGLILHAQGCIIQSTLNTWDRILF